MSAPNTRCMAMLSATRGIVVAEIRSTSFARRSGNAQGEQEAALAPERRGAEKCSSLD